MGRRHPDIGHHQRRFDLTHQRQKLTTVTRRPSARARTRLRLLHRGAVLHAPTFAPAVPLIALAVAFCGAGWEARVSRRVAKMANAHAVWAP